MAIYIRAMKVSDLDAFEPIEEGISRFSPEMAQAIEDLGLSVTGTRDGKVVGCGGVHPIDKEQGEMWLRLSKDCLEHKIEILRCLKDGLKVVEETFVFRQLNATIKFGF